ncbi:TetR family transcriptional regulator [Kiloniella antarctica]|uniref:TetR family transcriptional regulator n=1 Tax=Kiloniella antarctica TaxID=1550907 RepID=A0ABW5BFG5_9PROT
MKKAEIPQHIVDTAMSLAAEKGWRDVSLADISSSAKIPLAKIHDLFPSKRAILTYISSSVDNQVTDDEDGDRLEQSAKDRLFDLLMNRFDALQSYKVGLASVVHDGCRDPFMGISYLYNLRHSMALVLEVAGLSTSGIRGVIRIKVLSLLYIKIFQVWLHDDSVDLSKTMSALDKGLERIDTWARRCSRSGGHEKSAHAL